MPNGLSQEFVLEGNTWWMTNLSLLLHNQDINIIIMEDDKIINNHKLVINKEYVQLQKNRKKIIYK